MLSEVNHRDAARPMRGAIEIKAIPLNDLNKISSSCMSDTILYESLGRSCGKKKIKKAITLFLKIEKLDSTMKYQKNLKQDYLCWVGKQRV